MAIRTLICSRHQQYRLICTQCNIFERNVTNLKRKNSWLMISGIKSMYLVSTCFQHSVLRKFEIWGTISLQTLNKVFKSRSWHYKNCLHNNVYLSLLKFKLSGIQRSLQCHKRKFNIAIKPLNKNTKSKLKKLFKAKQINVDHP